MRDTGDGYRNHEVIVLWELAVNNEIQEQLREEVNHMLPKEYSTGDIDSLPLLAAVVYEGLRLFPPLSQLTNRRTTREIFRRWNHCP
jgi:unspecific monooxygenase